MGRWHRNGCDDFTHAFHPSIFSSEKERYIGPKFQTQLGQLIDREIQIPKLVQCQQAGGRIGRSAAHAGLRWNGLFNGDVRTQGGAAGLLQKPGSACNEVVFWQLEGQIFAADLAIPSKVKVQGVIPINEHEHRLQKVIAVVFSACDVQKQIELGGR